MKIKHLFLLAAIFALYMIISESPTRDSDTSVKVPWELRNDDKDTLISKGNSSFQFVRSDKASSNDRVEQVKAQFIEFATSYVKRAEAGDEDFNKLLTELTGLRVP